MTLLFVYLALALGFSFLCSILEAALLSITPSHLAHLDEERPKLAVKIRGLKADIDRPLSAILSLNTTANTIGAAGIGAEAQRLWGSELLALVSGLLTLLILVLAEIIPKTLGAVYWRRLTPFVARALPPMITILLPLVWLSQKITKVLRRNVKRSPLSREEFAAFARMADEQGVFDASERRILQNLFHFSSLRSADIMTPRTVVFGLDEDTSVRDALARQGTATFSRIPIYNRSMDNITGYVLKDELLLHAARDELDVPVKKYAREALLVPDSLALPALFERLLDNREHIAVVMDEYGGMDGVVSMEDVLETLLGMEIVDEVDTVQDMRAMARAQWRARAKRLGSSPPPGEER